MASTVSPASTCSRTVRSASSKDLSRTRTSTTSASVGATLSNPSRRRLVLKARTTGRRVTGRVGMGRIRGAGGVPPVEHARPTNGTQGDGANFPTQPLKRALPPERRGVGVGRPRGGGAGARRAVGDSHEHPRVPGEGSPAPVRVGGAEGPRGGGRRRGRSGGAAAGRRALRG